MYGNVEFSNNEFLRRACTEREIREIFGVALLCVALRCFALAGLEDCRLSSKQAERTKA